MLEHRGQTKGYLGSVWGHTDHTLGSYQGISMFLDTGFHKLNHLHGKAAHAIKSKPISSLDQGHSPWIYTYRSLAHVCSATHPPCSHDWIMGNSLFRWAKTIHPVSVWPGRQSACLRTHIFLLFITCFY